MPSPPPPTKAFTQQIADNILPSQTSLGSDFQTTSLQVVPQENKEVTAIDKMSFTLNSLEVIIGSLEAIIGFAGLILTLIAIGVAIGGVFFKKAYQNMIAEQKKIESRNKKLLANMKSKYEKSKELNQSTKDHLSILDQTDIITQKRIELSHRTLQKCLILESKTKNAFNIYSKLLDAYDTLLNNKWEEEDKLKYIEAMESSATIVRAQHDYVPKGFITFVVENINPPESVKKILYDTELVS